MRILEVSSAAGQRHASPKQDVSVHWKPIADAARAEGLPITIETLERAQRVGLTPPGNLPVAASAAEGTHTARARRRANLERHEPGHLSLHRFGLHLRW